MVNGQVDSFAARVLAHAARTPDRRAVVCDGQPLTYGALAGTGAARRRALEVAGLRVRRQPPGRDHLGQRPRRGGDHHGLSFRRAHRGADSVPHHAGRPGADARRCRRDHRVPRRTPRRRRPCRGGPVARSRGHRAGSDRRLTARPTGSRLLRSIPPRFPTSRSGTRTSSTAQARPARRRESCRAIGSARRRAPTSPGSASGTGLICSRPSASIRTSGSLRRT